MAKALQYARERAGFLANELGVTLVRVHQIGRRQTYWGFGDLEEFIVTARGRADGNVKTLQYEFQPHFGYRKIAVLLRQAGWRVGREGVLARAPWFSNSPRIRISYGVMILCMTGRVARTLRDWLAAQQVGTHYIDPAVPGRTGLTKVSMRCFGTAV